MKVEIRSDHVLIDGYVNAVGRDSRVIPDSRGGFVEQVVPGTFARALGKGNNVQLLLNHRQERVLGSTSKGEMELFEDNIGLRAKARITDAEVIKKAKGKKLRGWSFGFRNAKDEWEDRADAPPRRYLKDLELREVSIVDDARTPAYPATSLELRGDVEELTEYRVFDDKLEYSEEKAQESPANGGNGDNQEQRTSDPATLLAGYKARRIKIGQK